MKLASSQNALSLSTLTVVAFAVLNIATASDALQPIEIPKANSARADLDNDIKRGLIRDRTREYSAILDSLLFECTANCTKLIVSKRSNLFKSISSDIVDKSNHLRELEGLDATQVRKNPAFLKLITARVKDVLEPQALRTDLASWAADVEIQTRRCMVEYFRNVVAEDLGQSFDEHLKDHVIKAVRAIPVDLLVANAESVAKIEQAILSSMPEAAIPESSRKLITQAAVMLTRFATYAVASEYLPSDSVNIASEAAAEVARITVVSLLSAINEAQTPKPNEDKIRESLQAAVVEWSQSNLEPQLQGILKDYRREVMMVVEDKARTLISNTLR